MFPLKTVFFQSYVKFKNIYTRDITRSILIYKYFSVINVIVMKNIRNNSNRSNIKKNSLNFKLITSIKLRLLGYKVLGVPLKRN